MCANENLHLSTRELRCQQHPSTLQRRENISPTRHHLSCKDTDLKKDGRREKKSNHNSKNETLKKNPKPTNVFLPAIKCSVRRQKLIWNGTFFQNISYDVWPASAFVF